MNNNRGINYELDFEKRIQEMPDRQLLEFVARQTFEVMDRCRTYDTKIASIESGDRKSSGIVGGISGTFTAILIGIINYFVGANKG